MWDLIPKYYTIFAFENKIWDPILDFPLTLNKKIKKMKTKTFIKWVIIIVIILFYYYFFIITIILRVML